MLGLGIYTLNSEEPEYLAKDFILNVISIDEFVKTILGVVEEVDVERFGSWVIGTALDTKFKVRTFKYLKDLLLKHYPEDQKQTSLAAQATT